MSKEKGELILNFKMSLARSLSEFYLKRIKFSCCICINVYYIQIVFSFCRTHFCHEDRILSFSFRTFQTDFEFLSFSSAYGTYRPDKLVSLPRVVTLTLAVLSVESNKDDRTTSALLFLRIYCSP